MTPASDFMAPELQKHTRFSARTNPAVILWDAAANLQGPTDAIALKVRQEFAAKEKVRRAGKLAASRPPKQTKPLRYISTRARGQIRGLPSKLCKKLRYVTMWRGS